MGQSLSQDDQINQFIDGLMLAYKYTHEISETIDGYLNTPLRDIRKAMKKRVKNIG
jgi:hypothetical protein